MLIPNGSNTFELPIYLVDATDDETPELGLAGSIVVKIHKKGGSWETFAGTITEDGEGWYHFVPTSTQTNTDGPFLVKAYVTGTTDIFTDYHQVYTSLLSGTDADILLRRTTDNAEGSAAGDTLSLRSLLGLIQSFSNVSPSGTSINVYLSDGVTLLGTKSGTTDPSAEPLVGISTS